MLGNLADLELVDQDNVPFTRARLRGHAWIANFIFTTCHMQCPMLSARMRLIQSRIASMADAPQLLSVTILPQTDTPPVLKAYGEKFGRDPARWTFVTGKTDTVFSAVSDAYKKSPLAHQQQPGIHAGEFIALHGEVFVLLDGEGRIRGFYRKDDAGVARLIEDAGRLGHANS